MVIIVERGEHRIAVFVDLSVASAVIGLFLDHGPAGQTMYGYVVERRLAFDVTRDACQGIQTTCSYIRFQFGNRFDDIISIVFSLAALWKIRGPCRSNG